MKYFLSFCLIFVASLFFSSSKATAEFKSAQCLGKLLECNMNAGCSVITAQNQAACQKCADEEKLCK